MKFKTPTVGFSLILGGDAFQGEGNGADLLKGCLASLVPVKAEQIVLVDTGINDAARAAIAEASAARVQEGLSVIEVYPFTWIDHFAAARNEGLKYVKTDYMAWIDGDDVLIGGEHLRGEIAEVHGNKNVLGIWAQYEYAHDDYGNVTTVHQRERVIRMEPGWKWERRIHEVLAAPRPGIWVSTEKVVWKHMRSPVPQMERNLRLLLMDFYNDPSDLRTVLYLGHQFFAGREWEKAATYYEQFVESQGGLVVETWQALCHASRCYREMERYNEAMTTAWLAVAIGPWWSDGYLQVAEVYQCLQEWDKAIYWAEYSKTQEKPPLPAFTNPVESAAEASCILNRCYGILGNYGKAVEEADLALKYMPKHEGLLANRQLFSEAREKVKQLDAFVEQAKGLPTRKVLRLADRLDGLRKEGLARDVIIPAMLKRTRRGSQPEITIFCGNSLDVWSSQTPSTVGIGGAETAVVEIANRLTAEGYRVCVFNNCGEEEGSQKGVLYLDWRRLRSDWATDIFVAWRMPDEMHGRIQARQKWLWLHDLNRSGLITEKNTSAYTHVFGVSKFHADYLAQVYPFLAGRMDYLPNGIDLARFQGQVEKVKGRLAWTSSPDRGLIFLLRAWPLVKAAVPEASLHIFYGWENIDKLIRGGHQQLAIFKAMILGELKGLRDVEWRGRVSQGQLAKETMAAEVWAYPNHFVETFCIGALEAMAGGAIPVTSALGNIPDIVDDAGFLIPGHPSSESYKRRFIGAVVAALTIPEVGERFRTRGQERVQQFTWDKAADRWLSAIAEKVAA